MNILAPIYTDEFRSAVTKHNNESWTQFISDLQVDIDDQFLKTTHILDKEQLHVVNQQRVALQQLLTALITNDED